MLAEISIQHQTLVFRTSVKNEQEANLIQSHLLEIEGISEVSFDLEDWENVLRIVGNSEVLISTVSNLLSGYGVVISEME